MLRFIDTVTPVRYQSALDTSKNKTTFLISPLTSQEMQMVNDATTATQSNGVTVTSTIKTALRQRLIVQLGLRGWENAEKEYVSVSRSILGMPKKDMIEESLLNGLPADYIADLALQIQGRSISSKLGDDEGDSEKN